jgi:hypothetical protein
VTERWGNYLPHPSNDEWDRLVVVRDLEVVGDFTKTEYWGWKGEHGSRHPLPFLERPVAPARPLSAPPLSAV